jgi:chromosome segregation ATPase
MVDVYALVLVVSSAVIGGLAGWLVLPPVHEGDLGQQINSLSEKTNTIAQSTLAIVQQLNRLTERVTKSEADLLSITRSAVEYRSELDTLQTIVQKFTTENANALKGTNDTITDVEGASKKIDGAINDIEKQITSHSDLLTDTSRQIAELGVQVSELERRLLELATSSDNSLQPASSSTKFQP